MTGDELAVTGIGSLSHRYDKEGHAMDGQSLTEVKAGGGGGLTNWKTLADVKTEHLGHGDKVHAQRKRSHTGSTGFTLTRTSNIQDTMAADVLLFKGDSFKRFKGEVEGPC